MPSNFPWYKPLALLSSMMERENGQAWGPRPLLRREYSSLGPWSHSLWIALQSPGIRTGKNDIRFNGPI